MRAICWRIYGSGGSRATLLAQNASAQPCPHSRSGVYFDRFNLAEKHNIMHHRPTGQLFKKYSSILR